VRVLIALNPEVLLATGDLILKPDYHQGTRRAGGVAVLRDPYKDSWGVTKTEVIVVAASVTTLAC
jgi:hypothetical protein